jgi:excisionase family DNA binding protein
VKVEVERIQDLQKIVAREIRRALSPWFTLAEAADYLKVSPDTISSWAKQGKLGFKNIGGRRRYMRPDLDRLLVAPEDFCG